MNFDDRVLEVIVGLCSAARRAIHQCLGSRYILHDKGRLGKYMTACELQHEFQDLNLLDSSAEIISDVHNILPRIANVISP